jgi:hypothetical protein
MLQMPPVWIAVATNLFGGLRALRRHAENGRCHGASWSHGDHAGHRACSKAVSSVPAPTRIAIAAQRRFAPWLGPRFPPLRLVRRLPLNLCNGYDGSARGQTSDNPKQKRTIATVCFPTHMDCDFAINRPISSNLYASTETGVHHDSRVAARRVVDLRHSAVDAVDADGAGQCSGIDSLQGQGARKVLADACCAGFLRCCEQEHEC